MKTKEKIEIYWYVIALILCPFIAGFDLWCVLTKDMGTMQTFFNWFAIGMCGCAPAWSLAYLLIKASKSLDKKETNNDKEDNDENDIVYNIGNGTNINNNINLDKKVRKDE